MLVYRWGTFFCFVITSSLSLIVFNQHHNSCFIILPFLQQMALSFSGPVISVCSTMVCICIFLNSSWILFTATNKTTKREVWIPRLCRYVAIGLLVFPCYGIFILVFRLKQCYLASDWANILSTPSASTRPDWSSAFISSQFVSRKSV